MKKKSKKKTKSTALTKMPDEPRFKIALQVPQLPEKLLTEGDEIALVLAKKQAKTALNELKTIKSKTIDVITNGLKNLRAEYASACKPWENIISGAKALLVEKEEVETKRAIKNAKLRSKTAEKHGNLELASDIQKKATAVVHSAVEGVRYRRTWKARVIDEARVPIRMGEILFRPVDMQELNKLAKEPHIRDSLCVPGVEWYLEKTPY